ncbi:radical SAM protein [Actinoplanes sp. NPDC048791]|uniref:radical SAM protein n=1 Tax=Actinoplanes sp. NPDC048791 TaxID=3154623 RepID=UPI0033F5994B
MPALSQATMSWDFTKACNLGCGHCSNGDDRAAAGRDIDLPAAAHMLAEFARLGGSQLHLLGGEPLLRHDFLDICVIAGKFGLRTSVTTNGWLVPKADALEWMVRNLATITISIDGAGAAVNDRIRGRGTFDRAVAAARCYVAGRESSAAPARLNISHVLCAENIDGIVPMLELADDIGVDSIAVSVLKEYGNALRPGAPRPPTAEAYFQAICAAAVAADRLRVSVVLYEIPMRVQTALRARYGDTVQFGGDAYCDTGEGQLRVASDGAVHPCFAGTKHHDTVRADPVLVDIRRRPLDDIVSGSYFRDFQQEAHGRLDNTRWDICADCEFLKDHSCYPGCPFAPDNLKPKLCARLARNGAMP